MKLFEGKIGPISQKSHRKSIKLYRGSQEVERKKDALPKYLNTVQSVQFQGGALLTTDSKIPRYYLDKKSSWTTCFLDNCYITGQQPSN